MWVSLVLFTLMVLGGCGIIIVALIAGDTLSSSFGRATAATESMGVDECPQLSEVWSCGQGDSKVIRIPINGFIHLGEESTLLGTMPSPTLVALRSIRAATHDEEVDAIILDVDSGGGGITASDILYKAVMDFRDARPGRVVVSIFGDVAASGAYYIALASDQIMARPTSITGSIGVIMKSVNLEKLATKHGIEDVTIASGDNKDLLNPLKEMDPQQLEILQTVVDEMHQRFESLLADRRQLHFAHASKLADGRIFSAQKALDLGLIDRIGYWEDAMSLTAEVLNVDQVKVFRYEEPFSLSDFLHGAGGVEPETLLRRIASPRILYSWPF